MITVCTGKSITRYDRNKLMYLIGITRLLQEQALLVSELLRSCSNIQTKLQVLIATIMWSSFVVDHDVNQGSIDALGQHRC